VATILNVYDRWNPPGVYREGRIAGGGISHRCTSSRNYFDGGKRAREQWGRVMAGGTRARRIEPDHRPEVIPEATLTGPTRPPSFWRVLPLSMEYFSPFGGEIP